MLSWPSRDEWERDNRWRPLDTAPIGVPVDVYAHHYNSKIRSKDARWTARRFHGATWDGAAWTGIDPGFEPQLWTDAMTPRRYRALAA